MDNMFLQNPIICVIYDPVKSENRRSYVFLGDIPRAVHTACTHYTGANATTRAGYSKVLRDFYGNNYKAKLGLDVKDISKLWIREPEKGEIIGGGDDTVDVDLEDINSRLRELDTVFAKKKTPLDLTNSEVASQSIKTIINSISAEDLRVTFTQGLEYVSDIHIFPEDKFSELKEKIYLATNIPTYRQHVFYINKGRRMLLYNMYTDGIYRADIRNINTTRDYVHGIPIDKLLYSSREMVRVETNDTFRIVGNALNLQQPVLYVVDLAQFTAPVHTQLLDDVRDTYQFDLLYYGFVVKYWPQLTQECFYDYIVSEVEMQYKYPDLAKNKVSIAQIYKIEKDIVVNNYRNALKATSYAKHNGVSIAITQMIASVNGSRLMLNIRNIFERLRVTRCIPEIHAYLDYQNKKYMLRKRHIRNGSDIQFPAGSLMKNGITVAISLRKADQESFHARSTISTMENEQSRYMFLNIWQNGKYYIRTVWNEEDELHFDDVVKIMKKFADPIISTINNFGKYAFISGTSLPLLTKQNIRYQSLNICIFWKKVMLDNAFKAVRNLWEAYARSRIIGQRTNQMADKFEFLFRKGMHQFDTSMIERVITASNSMLMTNHYAHLSNNSIKQKWDQNYDGRIARMTHRTTDVRFEINDIREQEFHIFQSYIESFIYLAATNNTVKAALGATKVYKDVRKLRKLREQDPELYNLKKYGSKKVYSTICQNKRQPIVYTTDELKNMSSAEIKGLTEYWNFTLNRPAFYGCPSRKYPHLSFIVGSHPKHYCLPCCNKKSQAVQNSKKTKINTICLQKHKYIDASPANEISTSRHIMNYGKDVDVGRLSKLPASSIKSLLFNTIDNELGYYLYGVSQHLPGLENIGILYAVSSAVSRPTDELIHEIVNHLALPQSVQLFSTILNGALTDFFQNMEDLLDTIREIFLEARVISTGRNFKQWSELFLELFHVIFNISIFTFIDETGSGEGLDLFVSSILRDEIMYLSKFGEDDVQTLDKNYVILLKRQNSCYPVFVINIEQFFKSHSIHQRTYSRHDKITNLLYSMTHHDVRATELAIEKPLNLIFIKMFTQKRSYSIKTKFINRRNLCYGVLLQPREGSADECVYVPINYSVYISDKIELSFKAFSREDYKLPPALLHKLIADINEYIETDFSIDNLTDLYSFRKIVIQEFLKYDDKIIGLTSSAGHHFYFDGSAKVPDVLKLESAAPVRELQYDYCKINKAILDREEPVVDNRTKRIGESLYNNYIYQLFIIEFVNYLNNERNMILRGEIARLVNQTNFKKDVNEFSKQVKMTLIDYPADYIVLQGSILAFYYTHFDKVELLKQIDNTVYEFDRLTMNKLKKMSRAELKIEIARIASLVTVQKDFDSTEVRFPNVYMPCSIIREDTGYCESDKLIINRPIDEFVDLLATDLMDDLKSKYLLNNIWQDTCIDYFQFTRQPVDVISIYRLTE